MWLISRAQDGIDRAARGHQLPRRCRVGLQMGRRYDKKGKHKKKASRESDAAWRLTHLWGAANLLSRSSPTVARFYLGCMKQIGRRVTLPLDALTIKRNICKRCDALLVPGATGVKVRVAPRREKHVVVTCGNCQAVRRFLGRENRTAPDVFKEAETTSPAVETRHFRRSS
jgi:ribonuclease P protein subunit RPR2